VSSFAAPGPIGAASGRRPLDGVISSVRAASAPAYRRAILAVLLIALAFHYSLTTLLRTLKAETPLAYLGLVPIIALLLAAASIRPDANEPSIHDRQIDFIVGVPLLLAALTFDVLMPVRMSTLFWLYRMDLLSIPVFVAGAVTLIFGVRTLWRLKIPIAFLVLAWPLPYTTLLVNWLTAFTGSTLSALNVALHFDHVAVAHGPSSQGIYQISHAGHSFQVSVASACSGVNGVVGYILISMAFLSVVLGGWTRKLLWLALGLAAVWISNVSRIFLILWAGNRWGQSFAIGVLHPFIGLVIFNVVVVAMLLLVRPFGLRLRFAVDARPARKAVDDARRAVPNATLALAVVAIFAAVSYFANSSLRTYDLVVSSLGAPRLVSFSDSPSSPQGWTVSHTDTYTWATPFFGQDSTWYRYAYTYTGDLSAPLRSTGQVISDVINTSDVTSFSTYGIEACYRFHGYKLRSIRTVDLGGGVTGNVLAYYNTTTRSDWTTVYWHWPVKTASGKTRYERITLMLLNTAQTSFSGPGIGSSTARSVGLSLQNAIANGGGTVDAHFARTESFLIGFAHAVIERQAAASAAVKAGPPAAA
jgi:exosortase/archaeosortase family protein